MRARRRVPVRRGILPRTRTGRIVFAGSSVLGLCLLVALGFVVRNFLRDDPRFRINSASYIQSVGNSQVTRQELLSVFGSDIGRNVFFVPLSERSAELEQLPWVKSATVMRLLPNQLRVSIIERIPVAFVRNGNTIGLVDEDGVLLNMSPARMAAKHYSFPVVTGIRASDPLSVRAARMHFYQQFIHDLDSSGVKVSEQLSEVDISDPEDIRAVMPAQGSDVLVHFGDSSFLQRYTRYQQHLAEWRKQYPHLASVDMRYDNQVVLEMAKGMASASGEDAGAASSGMAASTAGTQLRNAPKSTARIAKGNHLSARKPAHSAERSPAHRVGHVNHHPTRSAA